MCSDLKCSRCGAAQHAIAAAKAGLAAEAVDNSQAMLDHAQSRATEAQQTLRFQLADMRHFTTEVLGPPHAGPPKSLYGRTLGSYYWLCSSLSQE